MSRSQPLLSRSSSGVEGEDVDVFDFPPSPGSPSASDFVRLTQEVQQDQGTGGGDWWAKYRKSYYALMVLMMADTIEYGVVMPSLFRYLERMDGLDGHPSSDHTLNHYYGLILSIFSAASMCSKPILGYVADRRPYLETFLWSTGIAICGNLLYFMTEFIVERQNQGSEHVLFYLLLSRMMCGVGCANSALSFAYVSRTSPAEYRTKYMTIFSLVKVLGFLLGPGTNAITSVMKFRIGSLEADEYNSPGLLIAVVQFLILVILARYLDEPPPYATNSDANGNGKASSSWNTFKKTIGYCSLPLSLCFSNVLALNFFIGCIEALIVPTTAVTFDWNSLQNSYVYLVISGVAIVVSIFVIGLSKYVEDRVWNLTGCIIACIGTTCAHFLLWYDMDVSALWVSIILWAAPLSFAFPSNRSIFSRLVETSDLQALFSSMLSVFASLGGLLGPYWVGISLGDRPKEPSHERVAPVTLYGCIIVAVFLLISNLLILFVIPTKEPILVSSRRADQTSEVEEATTARAYDSDDEEGDDELRIVST